MRRSTKISCQARLLCLLVAGACCSATTLTAQSTGTFTRTGSLTTARSFHTATLLHDGRVLIAGGTQSNGLSSLASAELYDPGSGTFIRTADMTTGRRGHTSTLLPDGRVLIAGGYGAAGTALDSAELYDPPTRTFTATGDMTTARGGHAAILLSNGKVLALGGYGTNSYPDIAAAEIYDPAAGTFTAGGVYVGRGACDFCAPAVLLANGTVLFPGQFPAQLYDPVTDAFSPSGMMLTEQSAATLLTNGKVLFAGGATLGRLSSAELYDPDMHAFTSTGDMAWRRVWHTLTLLPNGMVLAVGGETETCTGNTCTFAGSTASAELFDSSAMTFLATGDMVAARGVHTATLLNDGRVLVAGGVSYGGIGIFGGSLASAELYTPDVLVPPPALVSVSGDGRGQGAIFHSGTSHLTAPADPAVAGEVLDIHCTGLGDDSVILPQVAIGGRMATVLASDKAPGLSGVHQIRVRVPTGIASGPAVPVRLTYIDRASNEVTIAAR